MWTSYLINGRQVPEEDVDVVDDVKVLGCYHQIVHVPAAPVRLH